MFSVFLSLFLGSVLVSAGDAPNSQATPPAKNSESSAVQTEPSGVATIVKIQGSAKAVSKSTGEERVLKEGDALYLNETVLTDAGSSVQFEAADESLFTLSENTSVRMDLFDLDETNKDGHLTASVAKGVFRFVSGKVAKVKPENVNIEVPSGTIGIRGTIVLGEIEGEKCLVSLEAEDGDKVQHRIVFSGMVDGQRREVQITKPGFATMIEARGMAPKPVFELPRENKERFARNLPAPQYLPRDSEGRPMMNPNVRDPQKYPGPVNRDREKRENPGGPNPPNGPGGSGKENLNQNPKNPNPIQRERNQSGRFNDNVPGAENFQNGESAYERESYRAPLDEGKPARKEDFLTGSGFTGNGLEPRPGDFGKRKPGFDNRGPEKGNPGPFSPQPRNGMQSSQGFRNNSNQNISDGFGRPGPNAGGPQGSPSKGPSNQGNRPPVGGGKAPSGGAPPPKS